MNPMSKRTAIVVFLVFAFAYFLSTLIRAITATLSPTLTLEFALNARDLGLLAGGYFLGFSATQLPLGAWLDRFGPKKVILSFLGLAVLGCLAFAMATSFYALLAARVLCGVGVSACLMAPLTGYRRWFEAATLMRCNSWMLMTGALGMVAATLPVQWLMPLVGWRMLFMGMGAMLLLSMVLIAWKVPPWQLAAAPSDGSAVPKASYAEVWRHPYFRKMAAIGFFCYGGMVGIQTLWATPWLIKVTAFSPLEAATGMFWINVAMLLTYWAWGLANPWLAQRGYSAERLITYGLPFSFAVLALIIVLGDTMASSAQALFVLYFMGCSFASLAQPAVGMAFPAHLAGRALSAYNLLIFAGVFAVQWGIGLAVDGLKALGLAERVAFQGAMSLFLLCCIGSFVYFLAVKSHNLATS
jgi:MFS family permease